MLAWLAASVASHNLFEDVNLNAAGKRLPLRPNEPT
jgi:hypothetical protein